MNLSVYTSKIKLKYCGGTGSHYYT